MPASYDGRVVRPGESGRWALPLEPLVTDPGGMSEHPRVVVGIDGSPPSQLALDWAVDYVRQTEGTLDLVTCWVPAPVVGLPPLVATYDPEPAAGALLAETVDTMDLPPDRIRRHIVQGHAAVALVAQSATADLLVVGARGLGGFAGLLLGSVSTHCVHHAKCPVVVVPDRS